MNATDQDIRNQSMPSTTAERPPEPTEARVRLAVDAYGIGLRCRCGTQARAYKTLRTLVVHSTEFAALIDGLSEESSQSDIGAAADQIVCAIEDGLTV